MGGTEREKKTLESDHNSSFDDISKLLICYNKLKY